MDRSAWSPTTPATLIEHSRKRYNTALWVFQVHRRRSISGSTAGNGVQRDPSVLMPPLLSMDITTANLTDSSLEFIRQLMPNLTALNLVVSESHKVLWSTETMTSIATPPPPSNAESRFRFPPSRHRVHRSRGELTGDVRFARSTEVAFGWWYFGQVNESYVAMFIWEVCILLGQ